MKKWKASILALTISMLLLIFQNCGEVSVTSSAIEKELNVLPPVVKASNQFCSQKGAAFGAKINVSIIFDMSMSNLGKVFVSQGDLHSRKFDIWSIENEGASDLSGSRFVEVSKFIQDCGNSKNASYSVFGFSKDDVFANADSCLSEFGTQADALAAIASFQKMQEDDQKKRYCDTRYTFNLDTETYYKKALSCLQKKVSEDFFQEKTDHPTYHTLFVTDGQPTDSPAENPPVDDFVNTLKSIKNLVQSDSGNFIFHPIFYGNGDAAKEQSANALRILNQMASAVDPNAAAIQVTDMSTLKDKMCQLIKPSSIVDYKLNKIIAYNLTSKTEQDQLLADSDMDGVTDLDETSLGWDPVDSHSTGLQDKLCALTSKVKAECLKQASLLNDCTKNEAFGLSACDLKFSKKIYGKTLLGVDTDMDTVPDFLEILADSNPARDDMQLKPHSDNMTQIQKISQGFDLKSDFGLYPLNSKLAVSLTLTTEQNTACESDLTQYSYNLRQIPLIPVQAYQQRAGSSFDLSHAADENVVAIITHWKPTGQSSAGERIYLEILKIDLKTKEIKRQSMKLLGEASK